MSHLRDVIHDRLKHTVGILVADTDPCIGMGATIPADKRASFRATQKGLQAQWFAGSYAVAVLLCPGDDTAAVAAFAKRHNLASDRFHFYAAPGTDVVRALRAWRQAGSLVHSVVDIRDWKEVNQHFGNHWNLILHDDVCVRVGCRLHTIP